jgi:hypothetical protein
MREKDRRKTRKNRESRASESIDMIDNRRDFVDGIEYRLSTRQNRSEELTKFLESDKEK